jgi:hypothetical protein
VLVAAFELDELVFELVTRVVGVAVLDAAFVDVDDEAA